MRHPFTVHIMPMKLNSDPFLMFSYLSSKRNKVSSNSFLIRSNALQRLGDLSFSNFHEIMHLRSSKHLSAQVKAKANDSSTNLNHKNNNTWQTKHFSRSPKLNCNSSHPSQNYKTRSFAMTIEKAFENRPNIQSFESIHFSLMKLTIVRCAISCKFSNFLKKWLFHELKYLTPSMWLSDFH